MAEAPGLRIAIATNSLGKAAAGHHLHRKLEVARAAGFDGVELAIECLEAHAASTQFQVESTRADRLRAAARDIYAKARAESVEIIALLPFGDFDCLADPAEINERFQEAELWYQLCQLLHAPIFQIPSATTRVGKKLTSDLDRIAVNLRRLGLLAQDYGLVVGYEAVAWGVHINTWQQMRDIVRLVDLPNVRYCLDTFHIAAKVAGDPFKASAPVRPGGLDDLKRNLGEIKHTIKATDIAYLQLSDATVADPEQKSYPMRDLSQHPIMTQSRNCRMFPCEPDKGGVLPVLDVAKAIFDLGYRGWVSMEVFHTDLWKGSPSIPEEWATRGRASWDKVCANCHLDSPGSTAKL
ncbi:xylose isomerase-like protein [Thozetella sp. PMI_491]|nr:xylose isomerase-like protein [Thozetella sp. PMI_491]